MSEHQRFNLFDAVNQALERSRVDRLIGAAVRTRARGATRDQARRVLVEEMRSHGRDIPPQPFLDLALDVHLASGTTIGRMELSAQGLKACAELVGNLVGIFRDIRAGTEPDEGEGASGDAGGEDGETGREDGGGDADGDAGGEDGDDADVDAWLARDPVKRHRLWGTLTQSTEVIVEPDAARWLGLTADREWLHFRGLTVLDLELRRDGGCVEVWLDGRRVGVVPGPEAAALTAEPPVMPDQARRVVLGTRLRSDDGTWQVHLFLPGDQPGALSRRLLDPRPARPKVGPETDGDRAEGADPRSRPRSDAGRVARAGPDETPG